MDRLKFFIFAPRQVRCFACKAEGPSRLNKGHIAAFVGMLLLVLALTWLTGYLGVEYRPIALGSYFGPKYTPIMLGVWWLVVLSMLFSPKGHRCAACGSEFLKPLS